MNKKSIFVFGSNLAGRHGAGAALYARQNCGAEVGVGVGRTGASYALPTKNTDLKTLPLSTIQVYVSEFLLYATSNPELTFNVTRIGCGLAGYKDKDIAPMFVNAPSNCILPQEWVH